MAQQNAAERRRWALITSVITLGLIILTQPGCDSSSSSPPPAPVVVTSVSPLPDSDTALVSTNVVAVFAIDMDATTINLSTFTLTDAGGAQVSSSVNYDAASRTATLTPASDLLSGTQYDAVISANVQDAAGTTPLTNDFVWRFTVSPATALVSIDTGSNISNNRSDFPAIDVSGRFIVFESIASNLVADTVTPGRTHIYRKDTISGEVVLVSSDATGREANDSSLSPRISDNGRFVVFDSAATNLEATLNPNGRSQIYRKDLDNGSITLVSRSATLETDFSDPGASNADLSNDGRFIVFQSADHDLSPVIGIPGVSQIYLKDLDDESVTMISRTEQDEAGDSDSVNPFMSPDGRFIVFESVATNFPDSNGNRQIYLADTMLSNHDLEQISVDNIGASTSADCFKPSVSDNGTIVVFDTDAALNTLDTNETTDVYYRDRSQATTALVSANPVTQESGNRPSASAQVSSDGRFVVFESIASDFVFETVANITDIFVRDLAQNPTIVIDKINFSQSGTEATANSGNAVISSDGRYVTYDSFYNYDVNDVNELNDIYRSHNSHL